MLRLRKHPSVVIPLKFQPFLVPLSRLHPDPQNARHHDQANVDAVKESLLKFGQYRLCVVREQDMTIYVGNCMAQAMRELGCTQIAALVQPLSEEDARKLALADNRTAELATWNMETLSTLLSDFSDAGTLAGVPGWADDELQELFHIAGSDVPLYDRKKKDESGDSEGDAGFSEDEEEEYTPPEKYRTEEDDPASGTVSFSPIHWATVEKAVAHMQELDPSLNTRAKALYAICDEWLKQTES